MFEAGTTSASILLRGTEQRRRKRTRATIANLLSEDNTWERDAGVCLDPEGGKQVLAIHNEKFKNNKKFERYNYLDYMVEESTFLEFSNAPAIVTTTAERVAHPRDRASAAMEDAVVARVSRMLSVQSRGRIWCDNR